MSDPIDTSKLDPATLARHLGNPEGEIGKAVTANLNKSNAGGYSAALAKFDVNAGDSVIEIGFGNGREIPRVLSLSANVIYFGVDISDTMVAEAMGSMPTPCGKDELPSCVAQAPLFPPKRKLSIGRSRSIRSIFWADPIVDLRELRRVLRLNGRLVLGALAPRSAVGRAVFQHGFRLYEKSEIEGLLTSAHFAKVSIETINETVNPPMGQPWNRDYFIVTAE